MVQVILVTVDICCKFNQKGFLRGSFARQLGFTAGIGQASIMPADAPYLLSTSTTHVYTIYFRNEKRLSIVAQAK